MTSSTPWQSHRCQVDPALKKCWHFCIWMSQPGTHGSTTTWMHTDSAAIAQKTLWIHNGSGFRAHGFIRFCCHGSRNHMNSLGQEPWLQNPMNAFGFCSHCSKNIWIDNDSATTTPKHYELIKIMQPWLHNHTNSLCFCSHGSKTMWDYNMI